ncbi:MAG: hypothetical protein GWO02_18250 [Gammaproteobacteria bacterium]|nr:hypothetical protein [Gammaproteobacteria bacterium]
MLVRMRWSLILFAGLLATAATAADFRREISADTWSRPRAGEVLVELEALRATVRDWTRTVNGRIEVRHPGGEEGSLWAAELRDWLVALGVPSKKVVTVPGYARSDAIGLIVRNAERP